jgi:hypothetical protein
MSEPIFMKLGTYNMAPEPISVAYFINPCHNSVCMCIPPFVAMQQLGKHVPAATNTLKKWRTVGCVIFYVVYVLSKDHLWVCVSLLLLDRLGKDVPVAMKNCWRQFCMWSMPYQRKAANQFFPELLVFITNSFCSVLACMNVTLLLFICFSPALYVCIYICLHGTKCIHNESSLFQNLYFSKHIKKSDIMHHRNLITFLKLVLLLTWIWKVLLISYEASKIYTMACGPAARQQPRNKQLYNSHCYVKALQQACFHSNKRIQQ